jgi:AcrR family transcriptional regulator
VPKISQDKRIENEARILAAAVELFGRQGYHNTQVMDIVKASNVSAGTFYNYFKDKRDIFNRIIKDNFEGLRKNLIDIRRPVNIWDRAERIKKLQETYGALFDFVDANPQQVMMILRSSFGIDEEFDQASWASFSTLADDLAEDAQAWLDVGIISGVKPQILGHAAVGLAMQIVHSYIIEKAFGRNEAIDAIITMNMSIFDTFMKSKK